jgi:hypothetical protein
LKQCEFEPPKPKIKDFVLSSKAKDLVLHAQTPKLVPCTQNIPIAMKNSLNTLDGYSLF